MTNLILAAIAAALVAEFRSFPIALVAGLLIGIAQTELNRYVHQPGFGDSVPFIVIVVVLVVRGQALPLRDYFLQRLPIDRHRTHQLERHRVRRGGDRLPARGAQQPMGGLDRSRRSCVAFILLSIVVVTGYAGQLSLAQFAIAGFGAWSAGRLVAAQGIAVLARR